MLSLWYKSRVKSMTPDNTGTRFSVVIVNFNGGQMLTGCVKSAVAQGVPLEQMIVVDNGSSDDSIAALESGVAGVKVIRNRYNAGFASAVNLGLVQAKGEFILILNNDAELQPGALRAFAEAFDRIPSLAIAGAQLRFSDGSPQNAVAPIPTLIAEIIPRVFLQWMFPHQFGGKPKTDTPIPVESVVGACMVVRQSVLSQLGLMDEDFFFFLEETEWCQRARKLGLQVYYVPSACAVHGQGRTANRFRSDSRIEFQRSKLIFFKKYRPMVDYLCVSAVLPIKSLFNAVANTVLCILTVCAIKSQRERTFGYWRIAAWNLLGRPTKWGLPGKELREGIIGK